MFHNIHQTTLYRFLKKCTCMIDPSGSDFFVAQRHDYSCWATSPFYRGGLLFVVGLLSASADRLSRLKEGICQCLGMRSVQRSIVRAHCSILQDLEVLRAGTV